MLCTLISGIMLSKNIQLGLQAYLCFDKFVLFKFYFLKCRLHAVCFEAFSRELSQTCFMLWLWITNLLTSARTLVPWLKTT